jgi:hypothetical protein
MTATVSLIFAGFALVVIGWYVSSETSWFRTVTNESQVDAYEAHQKEMVVEGFDPNVGLNPLSNVAVDTPDTSTLYSSNESGSLQNVVIGSNPLPGIIQVVNKPNDPPKQGGYEIPEGPPVIVYEPLDPPNPGGGIGVIVIPGGNPPTASQEKLEPPVVLISGYVAPVDFPVSGFLAPFPDNPPGTQYRWEVNGVEVTTDSPVLDGSEALSLGALPTQIRAMATHPDSTRYAPSDVAVFVIQSSVNVEYARADGGDATEFSYYEATGAPSAEGIVLTMDQIANGTIHYTLDGSDPTSESAAAPAAFLPNLAQWAAASGHPELRAIAYPSDPQWVPGSILSVSLSTVPLQLDPPTVNVNDGVTLRGGDQIMASHANPYAEVTVQIDGLFSRKQKANPTFTIALPKVPVN